MSDTEPNTAEHTGIHSWDSECPACAFVESQSTSASRGQEIQVTWPYEAIPMPGTPLTYLDSVIGTVTAIFILDEGTEDEHAEIEITLHPDVRITGVWP